MPKLPDYAAKKFLIADDMPFMLELIRRMLVECGVTHIVKANSGAAALKLIRDDISQVDFIVADCNMSPMNGLELLKAVRSGVNPRIPRDQAFIMLTGQGDIDVVKSAMMLDVSGYLVKPTSLEKLIEALERISAEPLRLKDIEYYRAVKLAAIRSLEKLPDSDPGKPQKISAWVVMPRTRQLRNRAGLKSKIEAFKVEHATRDGEKRVEIRNARQCSLSGLTEGMILAEDVFADEDHLLLRRGAQLTMPMIDRLRELAVESKSRDHVWIGQLALRSGHLGSE